MSEQSHRHGLDLYRSERVAQDLSAAENDLPFGDEMPPRGKTTARRSLPVIRGDARLGDARLAALTTLASVEIETSLVGDLGATLRSLFDPVCDKTLPIYFGPLLGRLYLEGL